VKTHKYYNRFLQDVVVSMAQAALLVSGGLAAGLIALSYLGNGLK
jgi:hypothetical protein